MAVAHYDTQNSEMMANHYQRKIQETLTHPNITKFSEKERLRKIEGRRRTSEYVKAKEMDKQKRQNQLNLETHIITTKLNEKKKQTV